MERRITSADFYTPGDTGYPDAILDSADEAYNASGKSKMAAFLQKAAANATIDLNSAEQVNIIREEKFDGKANRKRIS